MAFSAFRTLSALYQKPTQAEAFNVPASPFGCAGNCDIRCPLVMLPSRAGRRMTDRPRDEIRKHTVVLAVLRSSSNPWRMLSIARSRRACIARLPNALDEGRIRKDALQVCYSNKPRGRNSTRGARKSRMGGNRSLSPLHRPLFDEPSVELGHGLFLLVVIVDERGDFGPALAGTKPRCIIKFAHVRKESCCTAQGASNGVNWPRKGLAPQM